nr:ABC transporter permease [Bifidobacterium santillanense]
MHIATILLGAFLMAMVALVQLMLVGEGSVMNPRALVLYGIPDRQLQLGLLAAGCCGIPAMTGLVSMLLWSLVYRRMGVAAVVAALVAAPLFVLTMTSLSKLLVSLSTSLVTSKRGKAAFYVVVTLLFVAVCQLPSILANSGLSAGIDPRLAARSASIIAWTPLGAAFQLPYDAFLGDWAALAGRIAVLVATWTACLALCVWCLRRERLVHGAAARAAVAKGIGAFAWMPDDVSGAVSARLLTYLVRDPRRAMLFVMPPFIVVVFALQARGNSVMVWLALVVSGWTFAIAESNGLAYDGRGFAMQALAGVPGLADRIGRVRVYAALVVAYTLVLFVVVAVITGDWRRPDGLLFGAFIAALAIALGLTGLGVAEITSCTLLYPVPPMDKPFSSPQGRAAAQGFFPFVYLLGGILLLAPTGVVALVLLAVGAIADLYWVLIPVALVNGVAALALGSWLGGKLLDARTPAILHTLDGFASLQR